MSVKEKKKCKKEFPFQTKSKVIIELFRSLCEKKKYFRVSHDSKNATYCITYSKLGRYLF